MVCSRVFVKKGAPKTQGIMGTRRQNLTSASQRFLDQGQAVSKQNLGVFFFYENKSLATVYISDLEMLFILFGRLPVSSDNTITTVSENNNTWTSSNLARSRSSICWSDLTCKQPNHCSPQCCLHYRDFFCGQITPPDSVFNLIHQALFNTMGFNS